MKTLTKYAISGILLISTGISFAQDSDYRTREAGEERSNRGHRNSIQGMPVIDHFTRALRSMDLSDEQKAGIKEIMQQLKTDSRSIMSELKTDQRVLKELIKADEYDDLAVAEVAAKTGDLTAEHIVLSSRAVSAMIAYLNDEQRAQLEDMAALRKEQRREKRQSRVK
jgi:Spy/CpxP family protein refolding chaperone